MAEKDFLKSLFNQDLNSDKLRKLVLLLKRIYVMNPIDNIDKELVSCISELSTYEIICDEYARLKSVLFYSNHIYILVIDGFIKYRKVSENAWKLLLDFN